MKEHTTMVFNYERDQQSGYGLVRVLTCPIGLCVDFGPLYQ